MLHALKLEVQIAADEDGCAIAAFARSPLRGASDCADDTAPIARLPRENKSQPGVQSEGEVAWGDEPRRLASAE